jgi:hypothetical protein
MMLGLLAKLADLKADGKWSGTELDADLRRYLARASSIAERLAGVEEGGLRRIKGRVEYPGRTDRASALLHLNARAIELSGGVSEVVQLYSTGSTADFDAATPLVEDTDFVVRSHELAVLESIYQHWHRAYPRCIRVTYTAGLADPSRIRVALATATWTEATKTLTQAGAFASYTYAAGDMIVIESGTGATPGVYPIASRVSDDAVTLTASLSSAGADLATGDIVSAYAGMTDPPEELQQAVIAQAVLLRNTADTAGLEKIDLGDAGGSYTTRAAKVHPALEAAVARYRRYL